MKWNLSFSMLLASTAFLSFTGCSYHKEMLSDASSDSKGTIKYPVAIVRTNSLQWEGEQTYVPLYADGTASGLVVVNFEKGLLYGTGIPDKWSWLDKDTVEICISVNILRNKVNFPLMNRDCAPHPITGKQLDLDNDGTIDLVETFTILHTSFYNDRPSH